MYPIFMRKQSTKVDIKNKKGEVLTSYIKT